MPANSSPRQVILYVLGGFSQHLLGLAATLQVCEAYIGCGAFTPQAEWFPQCPSVNRNFEGKCNFGQWYVSRRLYSCWIFTLTEGHYAWFTV
jgi:hypothetical protein